MERKRRRLTEEKANVVSEMAFIEDGITLAQVTYFKYIGRILTAVDDSWPEGVSNMRKSRRK